MSIEKCNRIRKRYKLMQGTALGRLDRHGKIVAEVTRVAQKLKKSPGKDQGLHQRVVFLTDQDQWDWLHALSESTGAPVGVHVRRAVEAYRQAVERKK
jgi:hypothetical protein